MVELLRSSFLVDVRWRNRLYSREDSLPTRRKKNPVSLFKSLMAKNARQVFTGLVISMWTMSFLMDLINATYDPPEYMNPLIMLVGGYLFATAGDDEEKK